MPGFLLTARGIPQSPAADVSPAVTISFTPAVPARLASAAPIRSALVVSIGLLYLDTNTSPAIPANLFWFQLRNLV
jgi:hypothetical protein